MGMPSPLTSVCGERVASSAPRSEAQRPHEVVDLAIALAINDSARLAVPATRRAAQPAALVAVLHRFDVAEDARNRYRFERVVLM